MGGNPVGFHVEKWLMKVLREFCLRYGIHWGEAALRCLALLVMMGGV